MKSRIFFLFFLVFNCFQLSVARAQDAKTVATAVAEAISQTCWSCEIYSKVAGGLNQLFTTMFLYFTQESPAFIGTTLGIFALVLVFKIFKIITFPGGDYQLAREWDSVFRYLARIAVVFLFFFSSQAISLVKSTSSRDTINPIRDMFVDGPLAFGTSLGCNIAQATAQGVSKAGLTIPGIRCTGTNIDNWLNGHIDSAKNLLQGFHDMGAGGIGLGISIVTQAGSIAQSNLAVSVVSSIAGLALSLLFVGFTISFGLRYVDALLRAMISLSLLPIFLILWVFDTTRSIAFSALRNVIFMAFLFACSGFFFVLAQSFMAIGCNVVLGMACSSDNLAGAAMFDTSNPQSPSFNYVAYLFLAGCCGVAIGVASASFRIAQELSLGAEGETGIGNSTGQSMTGMASKASGGGISRMFSFFGR